MTGSRKLLNQAVAAHQRGDLDTARDLYQRVLQQQPDDPDALHLLGGIALQQGRLDAAQQQIEAAIALRSGDPLFHANLAAVHIAQQRYADALKQAEKAVAYNNKVVEGWLAVGTACAYLGEAQKAERAYQQVLQLQPQHAQAHNNLANVLKSQDRLDEAAKHYRLAMRLAPHNPDAYNNLGAMLLSQAQYADAQSLLMQAVQCDAKQPAAWNNLGQALQAQGKVKEAEVAYGKALELEPQQLLWQYRRTLACPVIAESSKRIEYWRKGFRKQLTALPPLDVQAHLSQLAGSHTEPPYHLSYHGLDNFELRRAFAEKCVNIPQLHPIGAARRKSEGRPRIGVLVTAGHEGIFNACSHGLLSHWRFDLAQLVLCAPSKLCSAWQKQMPDLEVVSLPWHVDACNQALQAAKLDVLYFWEVGSDATNYYLARMRPAPVLATSWGTPESTALPEMDFYISCKGWREGCETERFSEQVITLNQIPMVYEPPILGNAQVSEELDLNQAHSVHAYVCVQNLFKLHPDFDLLIKGILEQDPQAVIYLVEGKQKHWTELLSKRLQKALGNLAERVKFLPRLTYHAYLQLLQQADCLLDSPHFSGGNTSFEALSLGCPIVTLAGTFGRSRFTTACYHQIEWTPLVTHNPQDYVDGAVRLASDIEWRKTMREELAQRKQLLVRQTQAAQAFQQALIDLSV